MVLRTGAGLQMMRVMESPAVDMGPELQGAHRLCSQLVLVQPYVKVERADYDRNINTCICSHNIVNTTIRL
jgi:hypothetical protein